MKRLAVIVLAALVSGCGRELVCKAELRGRFDPNVLVTTIDPSRCVVVVRGDTVMMHLKPVRRPTP